jgi:hypothetical protein
LATVFLSYASEDNSTPQDANSEGWVSYFDRCLSIELPNHLVWRDVRDLKTPGLLIDQLREKVKEAAFMVVVLSGRYADKQYTQFELGEFFDSHTQGVATDFILPVLPRPFDEAEFPPPLQGLRYIKFFDVDRETKALEPFYDGFGRNISARYWDAIRQVGEFIGRAIKGDQAAKPDPKTATVYLAAPGADQINNHWRVHRELESQKCQLAPVDPWPALLDQAKSHLASAIQASTFSVHLLGTASSSARRADLTDLTTMQLDLAGKRQQDGKFRRLIWVPDDLKQPDPAQASLIKSLEDGTRLTAQDELVRGGIEMFKEVVRDELQASRPGN